MSDRRTCPDCGSELHADSSHHRCPHCLSRTDLESTALRDSSREGPSTTISAAGTGGVLDAIETTHGLVPRVGLRDTDGSAEHPFVRVGAGTDPGYVTRYRIDGEIGRGGMGTVLKGRDPDLGREVALKVLREDFRENTEMVRRFVEEAQIGGQLQHPGIVPIYELGTFGDCWPFFSMKLVKGRTLAGLLAGRGAPADDLPRFLTIFDAIAQTVAYAHARGVIHRDLKPSNVMVGGFGEVQVMDWGLAKVRQRAGVVDDGEVGKAEHQETMILTTRSSDDEPDLSHPGAVLGTPSYMAPEQARGEIDRVDERADVFALGSILCEILTSESAFTGRTSIEIVRKASRGDLADACERLDACGADADLVALAKDCLAREPEDRPSGAGVVAERVTRYLAGVQERLRVAEIARAAETARAEEAIERTKAERRARQFQLGLAASLLALTTLGGLSFTFFLQQSQARVAQVELALKVATLRREHARADPIDPGLWTSATEAARRAEAVLGKGGSVALRRRVRALVDAIEVEAGAARRDRQLLDALADIRASRLDRGLTVTDAAYADTLRGHGIDLDRMTTDKAAKVLRGRPEAVLLDVVAALDDWASVRRESRRERPAWVRPLDLATALDSDPYRRSLRAILNQPELREHRAALRDLATARDASELPPPSATLLAQALVMAGDVETAVAFLELATERHPDDLWVNFDLGVALLALNPARPDEAIRYLTAARALRPTTAHTLAHTLNDRGRAAAAGPIFRDLARRQPAKGAHHGCLALTLVGLGLTDEARAAFEQAVDVNRRAIVTEPRDAAHHHNLGIALRGLGRSDEAIASFRKALRLRPGMAEIHSALGVTLSEAGRTDEAIAEDREALRLDPELLTAQANLATQLQYKGRLDEAITEFRSLIARRPYLAALHFNLGNALWARRDYAEAAAEQRTALQLDPEHLDARINLGCILYDSGTPNEAIATLREATRRRPNNPKTWTNLAVALGRKGDLHALRDLNRQKPDLAPAHAQLGKALLDLQRYGEALGSLTEAARLDPGNTVVATLLGICQSRLGRHDEAIATLRRVAERTPSEPSIHLNLGSALYARQDFKGATIAFRESLRLGSDDPHTHHQLGHALLGLRDVNGAIAAYTEAARLSPTDPDFQHRLGQALERAERFADAAAAQEAAVRLRPDFPDARDLLALDLLRAGRPDEAAAAAREAIRVHPDRAESHYHLGTFLMLRGRTDEAITELRESVRLGPANPESQCNLGLALKAAGRFEEALEHLRIGHETGSRRGNWNYPSGEWLAEAKRFARMAQRLPAILKGDVAPDDNADRLAMAQMCYDTKFHAAAVRLWAEALIADPKLADDRQAGHRYNAACAAALASTGTGKDDPAPDDGAKTRLRDRARDWLKTELDAWSKLLESGAPQARAFVLQNLQHWQVDPDLASVRDTEAFASLPAAELKEWRALWADVEALAKRAAGSTP